MTSYYTYDSNDERSYTVLPTEYVNPETGKFRSAGTSKKYRHTIDSGDVSDRKIMKNTTYRVLDPGFTMHACHAAWDSICMHACMSWPAVSKELLAAKYARVAPRCRTAWSLCWPQTALLQQRSLCFLCKTEPAPEVVPLTQALLSRFYFHSLTVYPYQNTP